MQSGKLAQSWTEHGRRIPYWIPETAVEMKSGPGGIISNVIDLAKWLKFLLNKGVVPQTEQRLLSESGFDHITTANAIVLGNAPTSRISIMGYGLGWLRLSFRGHDMLTHDGGIPGFSSNVRFLSNERLGIAILLNSGDTATVAEILASRIIEDVLGLDRTEVVTKPPESKQRPYPVNTSLPYELSLYAGTYGNPGYGSFTVCDPMSSSSLCKGVLEDFRVVDQARSLPLPPTKDSKQLYAAWTRIWSKQARFVHREDNTFEVCLTALFPEGYGDKTTPFEAYELDNYEGTAEFVVEDGKVVGFGFFGESSDMAHSWRKGTNVQENAMVWFSRL